MGMVLPERRGSHVPRGLRRPCAGCLLIVSMSACRTWLQVTIVEVRVLSRSCPVSGCGRFAACSWSQHPARINIAAGQYQGEIGRWWRKGNGMMDRGCSGGWTKGGGMTPQFYTSPHPSIVRYSPGGCCPGWREGPIPCLRRGVIRSGRDTRVCGCRRMNDVMLSGEPAAPSPTLTFDAPPPMNGQNMCIFLVLPPCDGSVW